MHGLTWKYVLTSGIVVLALVATSKADAHSWGSNDCSPPSCHMGWCCDCYGCCDHGCGCCWRSWWGVCGYTPWYSPAWGRGAYGCGCGCGPAAPMAPAAPAMAAPAAPLAPVTPAPAVPAPSMPGLLPPNSR